MPERKRYCVNCGNNIRKKEDENIVCYCQIDDHYIDYISNFEDWCRRWKKDRKWDKEVK